MKLVQTQMLSPLGSLYLVASEQGLRALHFDSPGHAPLVPGESATPQSRILAQAVRELSEYFQGQRREFQVPLDLEGTPFQKRVWKELLRIPYGQTVSYSQIARRIQQAQAVRAVGTANGKNPVCIIVPCHRVIAADGTLGGYSQGLDRKTQLLALEQRV